MSYYAVRYNGKLARFRRSWLVTPEERTIIKSLKIGYTLNLCSGRSRDLGDVNVDLFEPADIKADMYHLPFKSRSFDCVIFDPPFSQFWNQKIHKTISDLFKITKKRIILVGPWKYWHHKAWILTDVLCTIKREGIFNLIQVYDRDANMHMTSFLYTS